MEFYYETHTGGKQIYGKKCTFVDEQCYQGGGRGVGTKLGVGDVHGGLGADKKIFILALLRLSEAKDLSTKKRLKKVENMGMDRNAVF